MTRIKFEELIKKMILFIYPVIFLQSTFANMISFYVTGGNGNELYRKVISWGLILILFVIAVLYLWICLKNGELNYWFFLIGAVLLAGIGITLIKERCAGFVLQRLVLFALYMVPAISFAVYAVIEKRADKIFRSFTWIGLIMLPGFILFIINATQIDMSQQDWGFFGKMSYLGIAYPALFIVQGIQIDHYLNGSERKMKSHLLNLAVVEISALAIVFSGARGALIGAIICVPIWGLVMVLMKCRRKSVYLYMFFILVTILGCLFFVPSDKLGGGRVEYLLEEIRGGGMEQALRSEESDTIVDKITESADRGNGFEASVKGTESTEEKWTGDTKEPESQKTADILESINNGSMSRIFLYKVALREVKNAPLAGMGACGYEMKYGTYPHNVLIEFMVDFGVPISVVCISFLVYCFIYSLKKRYQDKMLLCSVFFAVVLGVEMMLSGSLYISSGFIWIATYLCGYMYQVRHGKNLTMSKES